MIIFGVRGKVCSGPMIDHVECPYCAQDAAQSFGILRYFHIFWIPMFVYGSSRGIECKHCKRTYIGQEMPESLQKKMPEKIYKKSTLFFCNFGISIIVLLFLWVSVIHATMS